MTFTSLRAAALFGAVSLVVTLASRPAAAAPFCSNTADVTDCDGDGIKNDVDVCPSEPGAAKGAYVHGFQDVSCFLPITNDPAQGLFDSSCIPVAARRIDDVLAKDRLHPGSNPGTEAVRGVVFVGVRAAGKDGKADALQAASSAAVAKGFATGAVSADALFACVGSAEFDTNGRLTKNVQTVYGYRIAATYARAILEAGRAEPGYFPDGLGLIRYLRDGSDASFWKGIVGTNGTLHDSTNWAATSISLQDQNVDPKADLPTPFTRMLDSACYSAVQKASAKAQSDVDKLTHLFVKDIAIWQTLPDGGDGPDGYKGYNLGVDLPASKYDTSIQAQALETRLSVFGVRPTTQTGFALTPGAPPPPPSKKPAPKAPPAKPAPPPPPKFGAQQFLEPGKVFTIDWNNVDPTFVASVNACGAVPVEAGGFSVDACTCATDALLYVDADSLPKTFLGTPLPPLFRSDAPFERWSDFFQGKIFSSPETTCRPVDDLSVEVGSSKALWAVAKSATGDPKKTLLGVRWNLRSRLADPLWTAPPGTQLHVPPGALDKDPYKAGLFLLAPWETGHDWIFATGAWYAVLYAHGSVQRAVLDTWSWEVDGRVGFAARYDGPTAYFGLPPASGNGAPVPVMTGWAAPGMQDYAEALVPKAQASLTSALDLTKPSTIVAAAHLRADKWNPGDDLWATNYANVSDFDANLRQRAPRLQGFEKAPANGNNVGWQWYPRTTYDDVGNGIVTNYPVRVSTCGIDSYRPYDADKHWPRVATQVPQASLWGQLKNGPGTRFATDLVWQFGTGSTALHDTRLHEGLDINWQMKAEPFVDPAYLGIYGQVADTYCFGKSLLTGDVEVPLRCPQQNADGSYPDSEKSNPISHCPSGDLEATTSKGEYDDDNGCNPAERIWQEIKDACGGQLKTCADVCKSWGPFKVICWIGSCTYAGFKTIAECSKQLYSSAVEFGWAYLGTLACQAVDGVPCDPSQLRLFRRHDGNQHHEMEIELEHRVAYSKTDGKDLCEPAFNGGCAYQEGYKPFNEYHGNGINIALDAELNSTYGAAAVQNTIFPFTYIPGMVNAPSGMLSRFSLETGYKDVLPATVRLLPDKVSEAVAAGGSLAPDLGFRAQFIGDLIVDCGHNPIRTEIHPPTNILLHASASPDLAKFANVQNDNGARRYVVFGWTRNQQDQNPPSYDLWPGPRPRGKTTLAYKVLQPISPGLSCGPSPLYAPNRIVCTPVPGGTIQQNDLCSHNPRMLPSCASSVGGGLIEVYWQ